MAGTADEHLIDRRMFVKGGFAAAGIAGFAALAGCKQSSTTTSTTSTKKGGTLSYGINNPTGIEPYTLEDENSGIVSFALFDPLMRYNFDKGELEGLVAEKWSSNDTADEWTFSIRKGTKFHDGTEVTAKSFKYGWERLCSPKTFETPSAVSFHLALVEGYDDVVAGTRDDLTGITCPDDYTLKVKLSQSYADFGYVCSITTLAPIPDCAKDNYATYALAPVGNGPFKMKGTWVDGQYVDVERFDDYYGDAPLVDGVHFGIFRDSATAYKELQAGSLDCSLVPANQMKQAVASYGTAEGGGYTAEPGKQVFTGTMLYTQYLVFNVTDPTISDIRVRRAIGLSVNRQAICDSIYEGSASPAADIVPQAIEGSDQSIWTSAAYDVDKAKALLDEAGYTADASGKRSLSFTLMTNAANPQEEYESMQSDWAALGIDVTINELEYAAMLEHYLDGTFMVAARGWYADYPIQDNYLYSLFSSKSADNMSHWSDSHFDSLISTARATSDHAARVSAYKEADTYAASQLPIVPLNYKAISRAAGSRIGSLEICPQLVPYLNKAWLNA